jgi:hypothetical protein
MSAPHAATSRLFHRLQKLEERSSVRADGRVSDETWITLTASVWLVGLAWMLFVSVPADDSSRPIGLPISPSPATVGIGTTADVDAKCLKQTPLSGCGMLLGVRCSLVLHAVCCMLSVARRMANAAGDGLGLPMLWDAYSSKIIPDKGSEGEIVLWHPSRQPRTQHHLQPTPCHPPIHRAAAASGSTRRRCACAPHTRARIRTAMSVARAGTRYIGEATRGRVT